MHQNPTDRNGKLTISRDALRGSKRLSHEQPPLLRGQMAGSRDENAVDVAGDDAGLEISIPDVLVHRTDTVRILHVDDNPEYTELTKTFLERDNDQFNVVGETSALEGFRRLGEENFDCIVADYEMPNTNGLEFLELVREEHPDLPFILFTGAGDEALASEAITAGVTDYVRKYGGTEQYDVLANRIDNAVERYRTQQRFWDALSWYQRLVEQDIAGVFVIQSGEFVYVNDRFADTIGCDQQDLVGMHPDEILCESGIAFTELVDEHAEASDEHELTVERTDGTTTTVEVHSGPVQCGGERGCIGVVWDQ